MATRTSAAVKSTAPKTSMLRRRGEALDEHGHDRLPGLAVLAVVADDRRARGQLAQGVAGDDPVEVGVAERADGSAPGADQQLAARPGPAITVASATGSSARMAAASSRQPS